MPAWRICQARLMRTWQTSRRHSTRRPTAGSRSTSSTHTLTSLPRVSLRSVIETVYTNEGVFFAGTEHCAAFLDALSATYVSGLRERADWVVDRFGTMSDSALDAIVRDHIGQWGAEFALESVLWAEDNP